MQLSQKVSLLEPSETLAIAAKAKELKSQGVDVISLSAGEPDFDTPAFVKEATIKALEKGNTKYTPATGTPEIREAIRNKFLKDQKLDFPIDQIILSCGAKHSLFNVFYALLNDGDEVIIPAPFWLSYTSMAVLVGAKSVIVQCDAASGFKLTPDKLEAVLTPRSRMLILNSPSNPTGAVYRKEELIQLIKVLKKYPEVTVVSDDIYEKLLFDGVEFSSIAALDSDIAKRTVIVNGHSKAYAMTGWRLGYTACPNKELAKAIGSMQSHSTSNPTSFAQVGGVVALEKGDEEAKTMCGVYQRRRDLFYNLISEIPKFKPFKPQGAFYLFVDISETGLTSMQATERLLNEAHVAVVPGAPFGNDAYIRMSFATSDDKLQEAAARIKHWASKL